MPPSIHSEAHAALVALLIAARRQSGLKQAELAGRLGRSQSYVSNIERGERRIDVIDFLDLARAMGEDPAALFARLVAAL